MDTMDSGNDTDSELMSTEMLEDILDVSQPPLGVNRRESRYIILMALKEDKQNGNERYYLCKTWETFYTNFLKLS